MLSSCAAHISLKVKTKLRARLLRELRTLLWTAPLCNAQIFKVKPGEALSPWKIEPEYLQSRFFFLSLLKKNPCIVKRNRFEVEWAGVHALNRATSPLWRSLKGSFEDFVQRLFFFSICFYMVHKVADNLKGVKGKLGDTFNIVLSQLTLILLQNNGGYAALTLPVQ